MAIGRTNAWFPCTPSSGGGGADGLIAEYLFDNVEGNIAPDTSGNGHHLTLYNTQIVDGRIGKCLQTGGVTTSYAEAPSGVIPGDGPFSFSIWIRRDYLHNNPTAIFCNKNTTGGSGVQFNAQQKPSLIINVAATSAGATPALNDDLPLGVWRHYAFTHNGESGGIGRLYADGVLLKEAVLNGTRGEGEFNLQIGKRTSTAWLGYVDNLRFYAKELTAEKVLELFQEAT